MSVFAYLGRLTMLAAAGLFAIAAIAQEPASIGERADRAAEEGFARFARGEYVAAAEAWDTALTALAQMRDRGRLSPLVARIGQAFAEARPTDNARSLRLAGALNMVGGQYGNLGAYHLALPLFQRSLALRRELLGERHADTVTSIKNLGLIYSRMGENDEATRLLEYSLGAEERRAPASREIAGTLASLAALDHESGRYESAITRATRAVTILEALVGPDHPDVAPALTNLGSTYLRTDQLPAALATHERALRLYQRLGVSHPSTARAHANLAEAYRRLGRSAEGLSSIQRAVTVSVQTEGNGQSLARYLGNLALTYSVAGAPEVAIFFDKLAINMLQNIRENFIALPAQLQRSYTRSQENPYRRLARALARTGRIAEARVALEMIREEEYFDFIRRDAASDPRRARIAFHGIEARWAERFAELVRDFTDLRTRSIEAIARSRASGAPLSESARASLRQELAERRARLDSFFAELPIALAHDQADTREERAARERAIALEQRAAIGSLGPDVALVQYVMLGDEQRVFVTTARAASTHVLALRDEEINRLVVQFRRGLESPSVDARPGARALYDAVFRPIAAALTGTRTVMLSLDGTLRYAPFAALHDGDEWLIERHRLVLHVPAAQTRLADAAPGRWRIAGFGLTRAASGFPALPNVRAELESIVSASSAGGDAYFDEDFTESRLRAALQRTEPVLHIASHFRFMPGSEADSFLLLGDGSRLSLRALREGDFRFDHLDLLTLSACETAMAGGREADGSEVEGLAALAMRKGAKSVLAALWPIADRSTAQLMAALYRSRDRDGVDKLEALRRAQLALLRGTAGALPPRGARGTIEADTENNSATRGLQRELPDGSRIAAPPSGLPYAHPYYWAPFILAGNWR